MSTTTSYTDRSLTSTTAYAYSVRAVDTAGHRGPASDVLNVTTATPDLPPSAPGQLTAVATSPRTSTLTWGLANDDHGIVAYEVVLDRGTVYVDANSGQILYNGAAVAVASGGGEHHEGGEHAGGEHEGGGDD